MTLEEFVRNLARGSYLDNLARVETLTDVARKLVRELDAKPEPGPTIVYVLFRETNTGDAAGDSDGYVEGVYETEEAAQAAMDEAAREAKEEGKIVGYNPDDPDEEEDPHWEADWRIERQQVYK